MYTPKNAQVFTAAFSGALAGMLASDRNPTSPNPSVYLGGAAVAGAWAQEFDTLWDITPAASLQLQSIQSACAAVWQDRAPQADPQTTLIPAHWQGLCAAVIAIVQSGTLYFASQNTPNLGIESLIVYAPAQLITSPPVYNKWEDVQAIANLKQGACRIIVDHSGGLGFADIPATADLDGQGRLEIVGGGPRGEATLLMADGAQIRNVRQWQDIVVRGAPTIRPCIVYDMNGLIVYAYDATFLFSNNTATKPIIDVIPGGIVFPNGYFGIFFEGSSELRNSHNPGKPVLHVGQTALFFFSIGQLYFASPFDATVSGEPTSQMFLQTDSSLPDPATISFPDFLGSITTLQINTAPGVGYTPSVLADWSGILPITVQNALDRIAAKITPIP